MEIYKSKILIDKIVYKDKIGNLIVIVFLNPEKNITIDQELFSPKVPEYYDFIFQ